MTSQAFPIAALVLAHDADPSWTSALAALAATARDLGAAPVVVAAPPAIELPTTVRVVRTRESSTRIGAVRLGMAQLANTPARVVLLLPHDAPIASLVDLLSMVDAAKRAPDAIVALADAPLDASPVIVPRDAWLELVTLGEGGLDALAARRRVERVAK
jgi:molybdopterin-guanine dinucleotide biosynthesis protein A